MTTPQEETPQPQHLTHDDVVKLVGDLDDSVIAAILASGASYVEIEQALKWAGAGVEYPQLNSQGLTPTAERVFSILIADPSFAEDEE